MHPRSRNTSLWNCSVCVRIQSTFGLQISYPRPQGLGIPLSKVGCPIRKFTDQSFLAAPRDLSQRSTSFIASQRQGIHQMPLFHLNALIINAHSTRRGTSNVARVICVMRTSFDLSTDRKTNLFRDRPEGVRLNNAWMLPQHGSSPRATSDRSPSSRCQTTTPSTIFDRGGRKTVA
jgi:hypothetical protein